MMPQSIGSSDDEKVSISVREIENGFITSKSWDKGGKYYHKERWSKEPPDLDKESFEKAPLNTRKERVEFMSKEMKKKNDKNYKK